MRWTSWFLNDVCGTFQIQTAAINIQIQCFIFNNVLCLSEFSTLSHSHAVKSKRLGSQGLRHAPFFSCLCYTWDFQTSENTSLYSLFEGNGQRSSMMSRRGLTKQLVNGAMCMLGVLLSTIIQFLHASHFWSILTCSHNLLTFRPCSHQKPLHSLRGLWNCVALDVQVLKLGVHSAEGLPLRHCTHFIFDHGSRLPPSLLSTYDGEVCNCELPVILSLSVWTQPWNTYVMGSKWGSNTWEI